MDHRREYRDPRDHWNSYRPPADDRRHQSRSRPNQPYRRNSRFDVEPRDVRSPDDTPSDSPRSPRAKYGDPSSSANVRSPVSRDPRRLREPVLEPPPTKEIDTNSSGTTLEDVIREFAKQFSYEEKVKEAQSNLTILQQEQREKKEMFADTPALSDMLQQKCKKMEATLSNYSQLAADSRDRAEKLVGDLPSNLRHLLRNVDAAPIPAPEQLPTDRSNELDELKTNMNSLAEKLDVVIKQNKEQELEIQRMRQENSKTALGHLEHDLDSKISVVRTDVESRFTSLEQTYSKLENNKAPSDEAINRQKEHSMRQDSEFTSLRQEQTKLTELVASLQKGFTLTETQSAQNAVRERPKSPSHDDRDTEIAAIQEQQKEQKRQIANLSNTFVSCKEFKEFRLESNTTKTLIEKQLHETVKAQGDTTKRFAELDEQATQLCATVDDVKLKLSETAGKNSDALDDGMKSLETSQERLQQQCKRLESDVEKLVIWRATKTKESDTQVAAHDTKQLAKLEADIKKLQNFRPHYQKFYEETQEGFKTTNKQCSNLDKAIKDLQNGQNSVRFRLGSLEDTEKETQKSITKFSEHNKKMADQHSAFCTSVENQISTLKTSSTQSIESLSSQAKVAVADIEALKIYNKQVNHSIQSLDARYNGISTQKLYHAIVATIQPLLPELYDTSRNIKTLQTSVTMYAQKIVELDEKLQRVKSERVEKEKSTQRTVADQGASTMSANSTASLQQNASFQAVSSDRNEDLLPRESVAQLKKSQSDCASRLQKVEGDLTTLQQALKDEDHSKVTTNNLAGLLKEAWDELVKNSGGDAPVGNKALGEQKRYNAVLEEARKRMDHLEATLKEDKKLLDVLRADIELVEDLQARVQRLQTNTTTHQTRLDQIETGLLQVGETEKRLNELEMDTKFPPRDRYVVFHNIASSITEDRIRAKFGEGSEVKVMKLRGEKVGDLKISNRYALVSLATSKAVDEKVRDFRTLNESHRKGWSGRLPKLRELDRQLFLKLWTEEPNSVQDLFDEPPGDKRSIVSSLPAISSREVSTPFSIQSEAQSEESQTIRIKPPAVLSTKSTAPKNLSELPDSDDEGMMNGERLLEQFNPGHDGRKPGRPPPSKKGTSTSATPSSRVAKRAAADLGSSRGSSKRSRRE